MANASGMLAISSGHCSPGGLVDRPGRPHPESAPHDQYRRTQEHGPEGHAAAPAEDVFRVLLDDRSDIGLATVYRVLTQFEQAGLLTRSNFESGKAVYELNEGQHHDHLVCLDCGRVEEFFDPEIEKRQQMIAQTRQERAGLALTAPKSAAQSPLPMAARWRATNSW